MLRSIDKQSGESIESVLEKKRKATVGRICRKEKCKGEIDVIVSSRSAVRARCRLAKEVDETRWFDDASDMCSGLYSCNCKPSTTTSSSTLLFPAATLRRCWIFSSQLKTEHSKYTHITINCPLFTAVDGHLLRSAQQQTRRTSMLPSIDGTDRRTDGRTADRYIDPALHSMWTLSKLLAVSQKRSSMACYSFILFSLIYCGKFLHASLL